MWVSQVQSQMSTIGPRVLKILQDSFAINLKSLPNSDYEITYTDVPVQQGENVFCIFCLEKHVNLIWTKYTKFTKDNYEAHLQVKRSVFWHSSYAYIPYP